MRVADAEKNSAVAKKDLADAKKDLADAKSKENKPDIEECKQVVSSARKCLIAAQDTLFAAQRTLKVANVGLAEIAEILIPSTCKFMFVIFSLRICMCNSLQKIITSVHSSPIHSDSGT